jgi:hypothetical protein
LLRIGSLSLHCEDNVLLGQGCQSSFRNDVFAGFQDLPGKPSEEETESTLLRVRVGKSDDNHVPTFQEAGCESL